MFAPVMLASFCFPPLCSGKGWRLLRAAQGVFSSSSVLLGQDPGSIASMLADMTRPGEPIFTTLFSSSSSLWWGLSRAVNSSTRVMSSQSKAWRKHSATEVRAVGSVITPAREEERVEYISILVKEGEVQKYFTVRRGYDER